VSSDPALDWLLANDPAAQRLSRREYSRAIGILTPQVESDIRAHETPMSLLPLRLRKQLGDSIEDDYSEDSAP
jgi:hypothetical protein